MANKPTIIDGRRTLNPKEAEKLGFLYYGIGLANKETIKNRNLEATEASIT